jgi:hypothetical protein
MARKSSSKPADKKSVEALQHGEDRRKNIPTAEYQSVVRQRYRELLGR